MTIEVNISTKPSLVSRALRTVRRRGLDLLYPPACVSCSAELPTESRGATAERSPFCEACRDELALFFGPSCGQCGAPLSDAKALATPIVEGSAPDVRGCPHCAKHKFWFDQTIAAGEYEGRLRDLLLRMKHPPGEALSIAMGHLIAEHCGVALKSTAADVVAPVPMHWRRRLVRGTNSAAVLAEVLANELRLPLAAGLLRRRRHTPPQSSQTPPKRWENMRRAFSVSAAYYLCNARVLLVDDILTTGATCSEAARSLRNAGAGHVTVVVAARAIT